MASRSMLTYGPDFPGLDERRLPDATPGAFVSRNVRTERGALEGLETVLPNDWAGTVGTIQAVSGIMGPRMVAGVSALRVYGVPDFTSDTPFPVYDDPRAFQNAWQIQVDGSGNLMVPSVLRVMRFPKGQTTADKAWGYAHVDGPPDGPPDDHVGMPGSGLALHPNGGFFVSDLSNNRVLYFPPASDAATVVYGQPDWNLGNGPQAPEDYGLLQPDGLAYDPAAGLYVADRFQHRILFYPNTGGIPDTTPTLIIGQDDEYGTSANKGGAVGASTLSAPAGISVAPNGDLYVADNGNNRVLAFRRGEATAFRVYGQEDFSETGSYYPEEARTLSAPWAVCAVEGGVYFGSSWPGRVVFCEGESTTPSVFYGKRSARDTDDSTYPDARTLGTTIWGIAEGQDGVYVQDQGAFRILMFPKASDLL